MSQEILYTNTDYWFSNLTMKDLEQIEYRTMFQIPKQLKNREPWQEKGSFNKNKSYEEQQKIINILQSQINSLKEDISEINETLKLSYARETQYVEQIIDLRHDKDKAYIKIAEQSIKIDDLSKELNNMQSKSVNRLIDLS